MKKIYVLGLLLPFFCFTQQSDFIHVDQFGYKINNTKVAVISNPEIGFNSNQSYIPNTILEVKNAQTNITVFSGNITSWNNGNIHNQSGDRGWWFDFTNLTTPGDYYIYDPLTTETSATFKIDDTVYDNILNVASKMLAKFYS